MAAELTAVPRPFIPGLLLPACLLACAALCPWQSSFAQSSPAQSGTAQSSTPQLSPADAQALVNRALGNELRAAQDMSHPLRYTLRKASPRLTTTKQIVETKDGAVARLMAVNDAPLSAADAQKEQERLDALVADPGLQRHRKQSEANDTARAVRVLRALPQAFIYQYAGTVNMPAGTVAKFTFKPNPSFNPPDLETEVLTAMTGEMWIDVAQERVTHLEGHLQQDVDFGWGVLGRLYKDGWIKIDQADVGTGQWRIARFQMQMSGRVIFRTRVYDTTQEQTQFAPVPADMGYAQAIRTMLATPAADNGSH